MKLDKIPDWLVIVLFVLLAILWWRWIIPLIYPEKPLESMSKPLGNNLITVQGNTLVGIVNPIYIRPIINTQVLGCIDNEETRNGELYGDYNYWCKNTLFPSPYCAFGCLQFWQRTFKCYCMNKYHLTNNPYDIFDCEIQHRCADRMLEEGLGFHWTTYKKCVE